MKPEKSPEHTIHELIQKRWSPRAFSEDSISDEVMNSLLEAARWAPSSFNEQPWRFIYAHKGSGDYQKILTSINEFNQSWAQNAPVLLVGLTKKTFSKNDKPNKHALYDLGASIAHLTFEATNRGLYLHQMAGFFPEKVNDQFEISDDVEAVVVIAIGYLGNPEILPENLADSEKIPQKRKSLSELLITKST